MNKKLLFCAFVIFSFIAVSTKPILASSIQNLPGFSEIQVVFYDGGNHFLLELTKAELVDNPNSNLVMGTIYGKDVLGGLSGSNGALGNGDDHFVLSLSPRITGGYWLGISSSLFLKWHVRISHKNYGNRRTRIC